VSDEDADIYDQARINHGVFVDSMCDAFPLSCEGNWTFVVNEGRSLKPGRIAVENRNKRKNSFGPVLNDGKLVSDGNIHGKKRRRKIKRKKIYFDVH
jgi:hypothetical protein